MPQAVEVRKDHAEYLLNCLDTGKGIDPPGSGWRVIDMLNLAGACLFGAGSHGPPLAQPDLSEEQQAERDNAFTEDLVAAIRFLASIFQAVQDGEYEPHFEPVMRALVQTNGTTVQVTPVEGWR